MTNNFKSEVSILNLQNTKQAALEMQKIDCTSAGIAIMKDKAIFKVIKLTDINTKAANILKQTFLSKGGEVAISRYCADLSHDKSDVIIMATLHQYKQAIPVLKMQPWKLKNTATVLEELLTKEEGHQMLSNTQYKAVIFDLDGTLINSLNDLADSVNKVLTSYKLPTYDVESYKYRVGNGIRKLMQRSLPADKQFLLDEALDKFKAIYAKHNLDKTRPYKDITQLLQKLQAQNIKLGVCTNKHDEAAKAIIKTLFGENIFDEIIGDKPGLKRKPDPSKVLAIAKKWNINPQEIAYLGDSGVDMQTATNANMLPVGVLWGFRTAEELKENGAAILLSSPLELLTAVNFAK